MRNNKLLLALTLSLTACSFQENTSVIRDELPKKYLACYALGTLEKEECVKAIQFESERQGFKQFLNNLNLPCESIDEGPEFMPEKQAYLVKCKPENQHLMQFNYETKEWKLITENKK